MGNLQRRIQRPRRIFFVGGETEAQADPVQEILDEESRSENSHAARRLKSLSKEYGYFKEQPAQIPHKTSRVAEFLGGQPRINSFSCSHLLSYWIFNSPETNNNETRNASKDSTRKCKQIQIQQGEKISDWINEILGHLEERAPNSLHLIAFAEEPSSRDLTGVFTSLRYTAATISGRLRTLHLYPTWILEILIAHAWGVELMPWAPNMSPQNSYAYEFDCPKPLELPSIRASDMLASQLPPGPRARTYWGKDPRRPGNIDPDRGENEMLLFWQSDCTEFTSDFAVYIWEHQKSIPSGEHAKIILCPAAVETEGTLLIIVFSSCRPHVLFSERRGSFTNLMSTDNSTWSPDSEAVYSIYCVFEVVITDTADFVDRLYRQVSRLHMIGRQNPSTAKLRFLLHLEDLHKAASAGVRNALKILAVFTLWAREHDYIKSEERSDVLKKDLEFLDKELTKLRDNISKDQEILRHHLQLEQDSRFFRLTLLASLFLPLSFTTSFFGMNITSVSDGTRYFSSWTNATIDSLAPDTQNSTKAIASMIQETSSSDFSFLTVLLTGAALTITLPLSLFIGAILRSIIRSATKSIIYWRAVLVAFGAIYIAASIGLSAFSFAFVIFYPFHAPLVFYIVWKTYRAWLGNHRPYIWTSIACITAAALGLFIVAPLGLPVMIFPWGYIGAVWWSYRKRRGRSRRPTDSPDEP
ncbi:hypothetical protein F4777DRAFT_571036 [Nemania sp. FL0916]|nr:hypothetical protein F4777DRAFT_571036 [Nemania sp. FL0916]